MIPLRALTAGAASALTAFLVVHASGCGTDAIAVDECRDIENARCEAGKFCGFVDDVEQCKRFYRCLLYTSPSPRDRTRSRMPSSA